MNRLVCLSTVLTLAACSGSSGTTGSVTGTTTGAASSTTSGTGTGTSTTSGSGTSGATSGSHGATTSGGLMLGSPCTFNETAQTDPCSATGYECSDLIFCADPGCTCVLPVNNGTCLSAIGCQPDSGMTLTCASGFTDATGDVSICLPPCTTSNDCTDPTTFCINPTGTATQDVCFINRCDSSMTTGAPTSTGFDTCPIADAGDGQCLGYELGGLINLCTQNGGADAGEGCSPVRGGDRPTCPFDQFCISSLSDGGPFGDGLCMPISIDGGTCPNGLIIPLLDTNGNGPNFGVCAPACDGGPICANTGEACTSVSATQFVCLPK